jgi:hypothetical protein
MHRKLDNFFQLFYSISYCFFGQRDKQARASVLPLAAKNEIETHPTTDGL